MASKAPRPPLFAPPKTYVAVRINGGNLTRRAVEYTRWPITYGSSVIVSIYGLTFVEAGAGELIGRNLADGGAAHVEIQATGSPSVLADLRANVERAAIDYGVSLP